MSAGLQFNEENAGKVEVPLLVDRAQELRLLQ